MSRFRVRATVGDLAAARALAMALEELITPAAEATALFEHGAGWQLDAYYGERPDPAALIAQLGKIAHGPPPSFEIDGVPDENWVRLSQAALPPVTAGRFTVHGSHDRARVPRGPNAILIDAGEAFGTAHHATTQGCLAALDHLVRAPLRVRRALDLGCGSGVLAIALARRLPHARVVASDIDPVAVTVAASNARANGLGRRVSFTIAAGLADPRLAGRFDLIAANILAEPLIALATAMARAVRPGGRVVLSGILDAQAAAVLAAYAARGFSRLAHRRIAGWSTLVLIRRRERPATRAA